MSHETIEEEIPSARYGLIPSLSHSGSPRERGRAHGKKFGDEVKENLDLYLNVFEHKGSDRETVYNQAERFVEIINEENEEYFEEMSGIAEGSGLTIEEITILNARYEVMYSALKKETADPGMGTQRPDACTSFGIQPEITGTGHTYLGQNMDWLPSLNMLVMEIQREDSPDIAALTEAGIPTVKMGVNEAGIGIVANGLITEKDGENPYRKPIHVMCREVLDAERLDTAIKPLITRKRANSINVLVGHAEGEMIGLELTPDEEFYQYPDGHLYTHANHVESLNRSSEFEKVLPDSLYRSKRLHRLLHRERGNIDNQALMQVLQDHFGKPSSICRHPDPELNELDRIQTICSIIMDLSERRLLISNSTPCEAEYREFVAGS